MDFSVRTARKLSFHAPIWAAVFVIATLCQCTLKKPAKEEEFPPNDRDVEKSFFLGKDSDGQSKTFMCGWAPLVQTEAPRTAHMQDTAQSASECNVVFKMDDPNELKAYLVQPSYINNPEKWPVLMRIPVSDHFYREAQKDARGRTTNVVTKNHRSDWSARPEMTVEWDKLRFEPWAWDQYMEKFNFSGVENIEWDKSKGFLGFTVLASGKDSDDLPMAAKIRFNFMRFKHDPTFERRPYHEKNSRFMNVLFLNGVKIDGVEPELYASRWKLTPGKPIEVALNGFPKEYEAVAIDAINEWNIAFTKVLRPDIANPEKNPVIYFKTLGRELKYSFDMRYPNITWIGDVRISRRSCLGVAGTISDVRNGQILWGNVVIWGGALNSFISANLPSQEISDDDAKADRLEIPLFLGTDQMKAMQPQAAVRDFDISSLRQVIPGISNPDALPAAVQQLSALKMRAEQVVQSNNVLEMLKLKPTTFGKQKDLGNTATALKGANRRKISRVQFDWDRTFDNMADRWYAGLQNPALHVSQEDAKRSVIKNILTHELGHFMGLGHDFMASVLPDPKFTPPDVYKRLAERNTEAKGYTNTTSVMEYMDGVAEVLLPYQDVKAGPQDELVLHYLYRGEYPTMISGTGVYRFRPLPPDGLVPEADPANPQARTAFFPACGDYDEILGLNPYCTRWDRGGTATDIIKTTFSEVYDTLLTSSTAFTENKGKNHDFWEYVAWVRALRATTRVRLFYDYMRSQYESQISGIFKSEARIYAFYPLCTGADQKELDGLGIDKADADYVRDIFEKEPRLKELCQVNGRVVQEFARLASLNLKDYTTFRFDDGYLPSGAAAGDYQRDWGHAYGTWNELTGLPRKISALYNLTLTSPVISYDTTLFPIDRYHHAQGRFSYASLYPIQFTSAISSALVNNLKFAGTSSDQFSHFSRLLLGMGYFLDQQRSSNDIPRLSSSTSLFDDFFAQTQFDFSTVAILIKKVKPQDGSSRFVKSFDAEIFDFRLKETVKARAVYILNNKKPLVIIDNMFIYPVTEVQFLTDDILFSLAYKMQFTEKDDLLAKYSPKYNLKIHHDSDVINPCVDGSGTPANGLSTFFKEKTEFEGFDIPTGIANGDGAKAKRRAFYDSIDRGFKKYQTLERYGAHKPDPNTCRQSLRGLGMIMSAAGLINGIMLPETYFMFEKGEL